MGKYSETKEIINRIDRLTEKGKVLDVDDVIAAMLCDIGLSLARITDVLEIKEVEK